MQWKQLLQRHENHRNDGEPRGQPKELNEKPGDVVEHRGGPALRFKRPKQRGGSRRRRTGTAAVRAKETSRPGGRLANFRVAPRSSDRDRPPTVRPKRQARDLPCPICKFSVTKDQEAIHCRGTYVSTTTPDFERPLGIRNSTFDPVDLDGSSPSQEDKRARADRADRPASR
jgi:hypothetical protein